MAMRLLNANQIPETPRDIVFRSSRVYAVVFVTACAAACAAMIFFRWPQPRVAYYISAVIVVLLLLLRQFVIARFDPSNWLVRLGDEGLFIHFRSYLNERLPAEDPTAMFLPWQDIRSARLVREHLETKDMDGRTVTQYLKWIELELGIDPAPLVEILNAERARPGVMEKHWYGSSKTLYQDYPVQMPTAPFLRLKWQVVPPASVLLNALRERVPISPEVVVTDDFSNLQALPPEQRKERLRELDKRGETIAAVYMARRLFGCDLTEAMNYVKGLHGGSES